MSQSSGRRRYVEPCQCGRCPKLPAKRPPTKREAFEHVSHIYRGHWDEERIVVFAIDLYVWTYRRWVNEQGWRKPPEWSGGRLARHELRPNRAMFPEEARDWARRLKAAYRERRTTREASA